MRANGRRAAAKLLVPGIFAVTALTLAVGVGAQTSPPPGPSPAAKSSQAAPIPVNPQVSPIATTTILNPGVVSWVHVGDLHITTEDQQNYADFKTIINNVNRYLKNGVNFALLPGDNANDHAETQYRLIKQATDQLQVPLYAIPGDHDSKGGLTLYNKYLEPVNYYSFTADKYHFVFLNVR